MLGLLTGLIGALIGGTVTGSFYFWRLRREELNARCDELCKAVLDAGGIAMEYWATDYQGKIREARVAEAKILAAQSLIDGLYAELRLRLSGAEARLLDEVMSDLLDSLTGGDFTVEGRQPDAARVLSSGQISSLVVVGIRRAHRNTMPLSRLAQTANENRHRQLDLPRNWLEHKPPCEKE